jgi:hypothetical protein
MSATLSAHPCSIVRFWELKKRHVMCIVLLLSREQIEEKKEIGRRGNWIAYVVLVNWWGSNCLPA